MLISDLERNKTRPRFRVRLVIDANALRLPGNDTLCTCTFAVELWAERRVDFYVIVAHADVASPLHAHTALARDVNVAARPVGAAPRVRVTSPTVAGVDLNIKDQLNYKRTCMETWK